MGNPLRILHETRLDIDEARPYLGTAETPASTSTVRRAMKRGGLEFLRVGGRLITSLEAIERYVARTNGIDLDAPQVAEATPARSKRRQAELARVDRALDAAGIR
jgi:hypothetical protein